MSRAGGVDKGEGVVSANLRPVGLGVDNPIPLSTVCPIDQRNPAAVGSLSKMKTHTQEQVAALAAFEQAAESDDLRAFGNGRRYRANAAVVGAFDQLVKLQCADALTVSEIATVMSAKIYIGD